MILQARLLASKYNKEYNIYIYIYILCILASTTLVANRSSMHTTRVLLVL